MDDWVAGGLGIEGLPEDNRAARVALCLLAVDGGLGGVALWAAYETVARLAGWYRGLVAAVEPGGAWVEMPASATVDRVVGGLDLGAALATGRRVVAPGLLARADGGTLYVPWGEQVPGPLAAVTARALAAGVVRVEREGVSGRYPARARLVVGFPDGGAGAWPGLAGGVGLWVAASDEWRVTSGGWRVTSGGWTEAGAMDGPDPALVVRVREARERVGRVAISDDQVGALVEAAVRGGVAGQRVDGWAVRAARGLAALAGRAVVTEADFWRGRWR